MRGLKTLMILSIVMPLGLLTTFRLAGFVQQSLISETLEPVEWTKIVAPNADFDFRNEVIEKIVSKDSLFFNPAIILHLYATSTSTLERVYLDAKINASTDEGYIESAYISVNGDQSSTFEWAESSFHIKNLTLVDYGYGRQAFARLTCENHTSEGYFSAEIFWFVLSAAQTSRLEASFEITYFNGTAHERIIQPLHLTISWK